MNRLFAVLLAGLFVLAPGPARSEVVDKIVAIVNDDIITLREVERYVHVEKQGKFSSVNEYLRDMQLRDKLDAFIENLLIKQQAKKFKVEVSDKEVDSVVEGIRKRHLISDTELKEQLKKEGIDYKDFYEGIKVSLVRNRVLARTVSSQMMISDKELKSYYDTHSEEFREEEIRMQHIFVSGQRADGQQRAAEAYKLVTEGKAFSEVAKEYSDEAVSVEGGDIGFVKKDDLFPELRNAASLLMPGDVSPVVRTPYGYHVLKLLEVKRSESLPFETVKDKIHQELVQKESEKRYKDYMRKLRASAYIEVKI